MSAPLNEKPLRIEGDISSLSLPGLEELKEAVLGHVDINADIDATSLTNPLNRMKMVVLQQIEEQASVVYDIQGEIAHMQPHSIVEPEDPVENDSEADLVDDSNSSEDGCTDSIPDEDECLVEDVTEVQLPDDVVVYRVNSGDIIVEEVEDETDRVAPEITAKKPLQRSDTMEIFPMPFAEGPLVDGLEILKLCSNYRGAFKSSDVEKMNDAASALQTRWDNFVIQRFYRVSETVWNIELAKRKLGSSRQEDADHQVVDQQGADQEASS